MIAAGDESLFQLDEAVQFMREHDDFLVVSHVNPDGDAISSTLAVGMLLQGLNKTYTMANSDSIPGKLNCLPGYERVLRVGDYSGERRQYRYVIAVDCADFARIGEAREWFDPQAVILNIDHHPTNDCFGSIQLIRASAAATVELLTELADRLGAEWNKELAECVYTGLLTDTGGFRYANTSPYVMSIASRMLEYGAPGHQLAEHLLERIAFSHILLLKRSLATLTFEANNRICWIAVTARDIVETGANHEDLEGLVNYPRNIEGVAVGMLFKEVDSHTVKVSFRSNGDVDVALVAKRIGGGGHVRAAGCTVQKPLAEAISYIIDIVKQELQ